MVATRLAGFCWLVAQGPSGKPMPPTTKAIVLMALLGIVLLGLLLVVLILLGGHWVRRVGSHRRGPSVPPDLVIRNEPPPRVPPGNSQQSPGDTFTDDRTQDTRNA